MDKRVYKIVLAGLLHDIGKFYQRTFEKLRKNHQSAGIDCFEEYFQPKLSNLISLDEIEFIREAIGRHHERSEYITVADSISAGMERIMRNELDKEEHGDPKKERLRSVFEKISLGSKDEAFGGYSYYLRPLSLRKDDVFPHKFLEEGSANEYRILWDEFKKEVMNIPDFNIRSYLNALYAILQKYTTYIPSAAYVHEPDITLFDHLKTTAAIASCLYHVNKLKDKGEKEFLLVVGDLSGIQNFIYKISKSQGIGGISKRLRGRSFYLVMLQEVIARYIIERIGLYATNVLFCGGGRFELILPNYEKTISILKESKKDLNSWLFKKFGGELSINIEWVEGSRDDLKDYNRLLEIVEEKISESKKRKLRDLFSESGFWVEEDKEHKRVCRVCNIEKVDDDEKPCKLCDLHKQIGERLPRMGYIILASQEDTSRGDFCTLSFDKFGKVYIVEKDFKLKDEWFKNNFLDIYKVNNLEDLKTGFRFIGNTAPVAVGSFSIDADSLDEDKKVERGDVLSFEILADASIGDKRIGILKMDVDNLGSIFSFGLEKVVERKGKEESEVKDEMNVKSISRTSSLSRFIDIFFSGYINVICDDVFTEWKNDKNNNWLYKDKVGQIFYIVYSGGDDVLIVGPWSEIIRLAKRVHDDFKAYTCENPDIDISAGVFLCKAKYPISLAARASGEELKASKGNDRKKRITVFGDTVEWTSDGDSLGFDELLSFGDELNLSIMNKELPRSFVHSLVSRFKRFEGGKNLNFIPAIIYQLSRNVDDIDLRNKLKEKLISDRRGFFKNIKIPASYALLKSRKEV